MRRLISELHYKNIFAESLLSLSHASAFDLESIHGILSDRSALGLSLDKASALLKLILHPDFVLLGKPVLDSARKLRTELFGSKVSIMVPLEFSSFCSSDCSFCGWRNSNSEMIRLRLSRAGFEDEIRFLTEKGFSHFELSGGDDLYFLQNDLKATVKHLKNQVLKASNDNRVSICLTPLFEENYRALAEESGLDTVLTWQESYNSDDYNRFILSGPKRYGLDKNFKLIPNGNGAQQRMQSQELAVRAGLQVGIGTMIGLSRNPLGDILSVIAHGKLLIDHYSDSLKPLIIGMPLWRTITTPNTDLKSLLSDATDWSVYFEYIAAIYLLALPDRMAWVFPNCRVTKDIQLAAIETAGCFTSSMVRVGPGAYNLNNLDNKFQGIKNSNQINKLSTEEILRGEQFQHYFDEHSCYLKAFAHRGFEVVPDKEFLNVIKEKQGNYVDSLPLRP